VKSCSAVGSAVADQIDQHVRHEFVLSTYTSFNIQH
jgi:hypothetical protein